MQDDFKSEIIELNITQILLTTGKNVVISLDKSRYMQTVHSIAI